MTTQVHQALLVTTLLTIAGCSASNSQDSSAVSGAPGNQSVSAAGGGLGISTNTTSGGSAVASNSIARGGEGTVSGGSVGNAGTTATDSMNGGSTSASSSSSTAGGKKAATTSETPSGGVKTIGGRTNNDAGGSTARSGATMAGSQSTTGGSPGAGGKTSVAGAAASGAGGASTSGGTTSPNMGSGVTIHNDVFWKDTSGTPIYSQGGGVLKVGDAYYWYGVKYNGAVTYASKPTALNSDTGFVAVTIYSSKDLATWKFEGNALTPASLTAAGADPSTWIGRVGAAYNAKTKKYVLNGQYGGSPDTAQFFATSDTPGGPFTWERTQATITNVVNNNCGDQSIFNDDDGQAYLICSSLSGRSNLYVAPLRAGDFLNVEPATRVFGGAGREGNAMFKYGGRYYLCSSDLHGWNASHSYYISATNILGPYSTEGIIGNTDADFSHVTQTGLFVTVAGTAQTTVIFGGDRWSDFAGNGLGYNQWTPLTFTGSTPQMQSLSEWVIDAATGTWSVGSGNNFALNPSFEADRVEVTQPAGWTTTSGKNVTGGHSGRWSWQLSGTASLDHALSNLPKGEYTLSVWVKANSAGAQLYAKGCGGTTKSADIPAASAWTNVSITGITASTGACNIGVTTAGQNVTADDFNLTKN